MNSNPLESLSKDLGTMLHSLVILGISYTNLTELPSSIKDLEKLQQVNCYGTPLKEPKVRIAERGVKAIKRYFQNQENLLDDQKKAKEKNFDDNRSNHSGRSVGRKQHGDIQDDQILANLQKSQIKANAKKKKFKLMGHGHKEEAEGDSDDEEEDDHEANDKEKQEKFKKENPDYMQYQGRKPQYLTTEFSKQVVQMIKEEHNIDLNDIQQLKMLQKKQEQIIIKATDKILKQILETKDLNKLPDFMKTSGYVESIKIGRQNLTLGFTKLENSNRNKEIFSERLEE